MMGILLNVVHRQVYKNIEQGSLKGFITITLYQLCSIAARFLFWEIDSQLESDVCRLL